MPGEVHMPSDESEIQVTLNVRLTQQDRRVLSELFPHQPNLPEILGQIGQMAMREWLDWLSGRKRYGSISDEAVERIFEIFTQLVPEREPSIDVLTNVLGIPYGRARYICQVIGQRQFHLLNEQALGQLRQSLASKVVPEGQLPAERETRIHLSRRSAGILASVVAEMEDISIFSFASCPFPDKRRVLLNPAEIQRILDEVNRRYPDASGG
jgi:hypothetical protein